MTSRARTPLHSPPSLRPGRRPGWQGLLLRVLLAVLCLNASLVWGLHQAAHFTHEQAANSLATHSPEDEEDGPSHEPCGPCQIFAHLITPALQPPAGLYPVAARLVPGYDYPPPPALARSWQHLPRDPPDAS